MSKSRGEHEGIDPAKLAEVAFLQNSFFIFDDVCADEGADPDDIPIFFYPPDADKDLKLLIIGASFAMINFVKNFTNEEIQILSLERFKMAFKQVDAITLVLTGPLEDTDSALMDQLEAVYSAFRFYYGSFSDILSLYSTRLEFIKAMSKMGRVLIPLINRYRQTSLKAFSPLPYLDLPPKNKRFFLAANQLLNSVKAQYPIILSGCIFYDCSVLCTHLDVASTRWILNRVEYLSVGEEFNTKDEPDPNPLSSGQEDKQTIPVSSTTSTTFKALPVFLSASLLATLRVERPQDSADPDQDPDFSSTPDDDDDVEPNDLPQTQKKPHETRLGADIAQGSGSGLPGSVSEREREDGHESVQVQSQVNQPLPEELQAEIWTRVSTRSEGEYVGLLLLCLPRSAVAIVLDHLRFMYDAKFISKLRYNLSTKLSALEAQISALPLNSSRVYDSDGLPHYNFLVYDPARETVKSSTLTSREVDQRFVEGVSHLHNHYLQSPDLSQMWLRDHTGSLYSNKQFQKETYFQQSYLTEQEKVLDKIEDDARKVLAEEHNTFLL
eukprot:TRINITY_DN17230_c0_g1_i1.p1 TRINITY_DN17230_c0_g1~~TRINITY_DN17230_c0_g1_i1.p1  ORF type:complete len:562 (+),score=108.70 TRINITY_DN17230_c0_g1_i1:29-1687(+)